MPAASANEFPKVILEERASDGSDTANPAADHRALFLGEDGLLHLRDSAGTVTDIVGSAAHIADTSDAHDASAISFTPAGTIAATDVQAAIEEVASEAGGGASNLAAAKVVLTSGDITTTSTSFVDATGLTCTISTGAHRVLYGLTASAFAASGDQLLVDVAVDGTRVGGGTLGLIQFNNTNALPLTLSGMTDALSAGSHTIKVQFRSLSGGTATIRAANPAALWWVAEIYAA